MRTAMKSFPNHSLLSLHDSRMLLRHLSKAADSEAAH